MRDATVYVVLPQETIDAEVTPVSMDGSGLMVRAANDYEAAKTRRMVDANLAGLRKSTTASDFRGKYVDALQRTGLFAADRVRVIKTAPQSEEELARLVKGSPTQKVVVILAEHYLDAWYRVLFVRSQLRLYSKGQEAPTSAARVIYYSRPITPEIESPITGRFASLWTRDGAKNFHAALNEGIDENMYMLTRGLEAQAAVPTRARGTVGYYDWEEQRAIKVEGSVLAPKGNRAVVLDSKGKLLSVPTGPTYASAGEANRSLSTGKGRVYVFTAGDSNAVGVDPTVKIDGKTIGVAGRETYIAVELAAGAHQVTLTYEGTQPGSGIARTQMEEVRPVNLTVNGGERYYLRFSGYRGIFTSDDALAIVPRGDAEREIHDFFPSY
jgi:hypothetical protein